MKKANTEPQSGLTFKEKRAMLTEAEDIFERAKKTAMNAPKITLNPGETSSLGKVITTQEQADFFMKLLKLLEDKSDS